MLLFFFCRPEGVRFLALQGRKRPTEIVKYLAAAGYQPRSNGKHLAAAGEKQLSEDELSEIVKETISEIGANSKAEMGKVMAAIMPKIKGKADGSLVNKLVQQHLS